MLTRVWTAFLAVLATGSLAGLFALAVAPDDSSAAKRKIVRTVAEAGLAALEAEIRGSSVRRVDELVTNEVLRDAITNRDLGDPTELPRTLSEAAITLREQTNHDLTLAVVEGAGQVRAINGIAEEDVTEIVGSESYRTTVPSAFALFTLAVRDAIYVVRVTRTFATGHRLLAVDKLHLGAGSLLRRVLGSQTPAGIVRDGSLLGDTIGGQPLGPQLEAFAAAHAQDAPREGSSEVFTIGTGLEQRLGAIGRIPGSAGVGPNGAMLVVMARETAAAEHRDVLGAVSQAFDRGARVNWVMLSLLLALSCGLAFYLPHVEVVAPMRRLRHDLDALGRGEVEQLVPERYSGSTASLAHAAAHAHEALRQAFVAELELDEPVHRARTGSSTLSPPLDHSPATDPATQTRKVPHRDLVYQSYADVFERFLAVKRSCGESVEGLTLERFADRLRSNERALKQQRPDITTVQFAVYVKNGKAAVKAKIAP